MVGNLAVRRPLGHALKQVIWGSHTPVAARGLEARSQCEWTTPHAEGGQLCEKATKRQRYFREHQDHQQQRTSARPECAGQG
jgi:hypothetical protein